MATQDNNTSDVETQILEIVKNLYAADARPNVSIITEISSCRSVFKAKLVDGKGITVIEGPHRISLEEALSALLDQIKRQVQEKSAEIEDVMITVRKRFGGDA